MLIIALFYRELLIVVKIVVKYISICYYKQMSFLMLGSIIEYCCFQTIIQCTVGCSGGAPLGKLPGAKANDCVL